MGNSLNLQLFKLSWSGLLILYGRKCWDAADCKQSCWYTFSTIFGYKISPFTLIRPEHWSKYISCYQGMFSLQLSTDIPKPGLLLQEESRDRLSLCNREAACLSACQGLPLIWNFPFSPRQVESLTWRRQQFSEFWTHGYLPQHNLYVLILQLVLIFMSLRSWSPTLWLLRLGIEQLLMHLDFFNIRYENMGTDDSDKNCSVHEVWGGERCR